MAIYGDGKHNENMENVAKEDFSFYIDRKVTIWVRERHHIQSDSFENAKREMIESFHNNFCSETFQEQEFLYDTEELLEPGDNGGYATAELFSDEADNLFKDGPLTSNADECWDCDWVAANNDSSYSGEEVCRKCGKKQKI